MTDEATERARIDNERDARAAAGDTRARDYGDVCRLEFREHLGRCILALVKRDKDEGKPEWITPTDPLTI